MKKRYTRKKWNRFEHIVALPAIILEYFVEFLTLIWKEILSTLTTK